MRHPYPSIRATAAAFLFLGAGAACTYYEDITGPSDIARVMVAPAESAIDVGDSIRLSAIVTGPTGNVVASPVEWHGDAIATVDSTGLVVGVAPGVATVVALSGGASGTARLKVERPVASVDLAPSEASIIVGQAIALSAVPRASDGEALQRALTWSTSDASIVGVTSEGIVFGFAAGAADVIALSGGRMALARITVAAPVDGIVVTPASAEMRMAERLSLTATVFDADGNALTREIRWASETPSVATVDDAGVVTAAGPGTATITATSEDRRGTAAITVLIPVAQVVLTMPNEHVEVSEPFQATARLLDEHGHPMTRPVVWASSDPTVAQVSQAGFVMPMEPGTTTITVTSEGRVASCDLVVMEPVETVDIAESSATILVGETVTIIAEPRGAGGQRVSRALDWRSSAPGVASVDQSGNVTGLSPGTATITASAGRAHGEFTVTVLPSLASIVVTASVSTLTPESPTAQVSAVVRDGHGTIVATPVTWRSSNSAVLVVAATGPQTAVATRVAAGDATITASAMGTSGSVAISVKGAGGGGGETEEGANNLSWPVIFVEGLRMDGTPVGSDAGLRPTPEEGIGVDTLPFWYHLNRKDWQNTYYLQGDKNVWRAEWADGSATSAFNADVAWGDNITHHSYNTHANIHVEVALYSRGGSMKGFNMFALAGSGPTEIQGTDGTVGEFTPMLFTVRSRILIQKLDAEGGTPLFTIVDEPFGSEVTKAGKILYAHNFMVKDAPVPSDQQKYGWYRVTIMLDERGGGGARISLDGLLAGDDSEAPLYMPKLLPSGTGSYVDIYIASASGGHGTD